MHGLNFSLRFLRPGSISTNFPKLFSTPTNIRSIVTMASFLKTRSIIRFKGPDTIKFLQGLVTNDLRSFDQPETAAENGVTPIMTAIAPPPVYAAMLTPQGRFLYEFFLYRPPRPGEKLHPTGSGPGPDPGELEIYADVDGSVVDELLATLKRYHLRSKVDIEDVGGDFSCWQRFGQDLEGKSSSQDDPSLGWGGTVDHSSILASQGNNIGWNWHKDPRLACLGYRGIFPSNATPPLVEEDKETDERNFLLWRLEKGVAEGSAEIPKGEAMPLEYNLAGLELIARTHHRGVIRKRLIPIRLLNGNGQEVEQQVSPGSEVINTTTKRKAGTVMTVLGSHGLALVRLEEAFKETDSLAIKGQEDVKIKAVKPMWWPSDWLHDQ